jgi:methyltransferase (TIGR00027 family)
MVGDYGYMRKEVRRIESKSSRTAGFICMYRAASYLEKNELYKSEDYIAPRLLPGLIKFLVKYRLINFNWAFFPKGIYEYVIARTKYIDKIFKESIENGIEQILIFGAGFDSRAIRFAEKNIKTKIFELDSLYTQTAKIKQFRKRGISIPKNTIFIPIDFHVDSLSEKLELNGFKRNKTTLFILEGIIQYLNKEAVDELFKLIYELAVPESRVIFDYVYASVLRRENIYYGEKDIYGRVNSAQEPWLFGIEKGGMEAFLKNYNFQLIQNLNSEDLEKMFFRNESGNVVARINGTHCIAYIEK